MNKSVLHITVCVISLLSIGCNDKDTLVQETQYQHEGKPKVVKRFIEGKIIVYSGIAKPSMLGDYCYYIDNFGNRQVEPAAVHLSEHNRPIQDITGKHISAKGLLLKTSIGSDDPKAQLPLQPLYYMNDYELTAMD